MPNEFTGLYPIVNAPPELDGARNGADILPTPEEFFRKTCCEPSLPLLSIRPKPNESACKVDSTLNESPKLSNDWFKRNGNDGAMSIDPFARIPSLLRCCYKTKKRVHKIRSKPLHEKQYPTKDHCRISATYLKQGGNLLRVTRWW